MGGTGSDPVLGQAQEGTSLNNSSFTPTPDGTSPTLNVGLWTMGTAILTDDRDSGYSGQTVMHEYGHGVSNRLVGARTSTLCLRQIQSGALGEAWSDYFAISYFNNPVFAAYEANNATTGIRRQSYEGYTYTYEDVGNSGYEVHDDGEVWAATLWDIRKTLGQTVTDKLVVNGLKSTPCNPSMVDARDAILAADQATNAGANRAALWRLFAKHGFGNSAAGTDGNAAGGTLYNAAYDQPPDLQTLANPAVTSKPPAYASEGVAYVYNIKATNPNSGGSLNYVVSSGPAGMTVGASSGALAWSPTFVGQRVKVTITDGVGGKVVHGFLQAVLSPMTLGTGLAIAAPTGWAGAATLTVPAGLQVLRITTRADNGDADLAVLDPTGTVNYSTRDGSNETLTYLSPKAGTWLVTVNAYQGYANGTLLAASVTPTIISPSSTQTGLSDVIGGENMFHVIVPSGATSFKVATGGGSGDVDLFVKQGQPATCRDVSALIVSTPCVYDQYSNNYGNAESISYTSPAAGDYYIDVVGYAAYSGVTLTTTLAGVPATLSVPTSTFNFTNQAGLPDPPAQTLTILNAGSSSFSWSASIASGGSWLRINQTTGPDPGFPQISVVTSGLAAGTYSGSITVSASLAVAPVGQSTTPNGSPVTVKVTISITAPPPPPPPAVTISAVANGASFQSGIVSGSWFTVKGTNLSTTTRIWTGTDFQGNNLPTSLDGVSVTVNGKNALIYFISPTQINALAPTDSTTGSVTVAVKNSVGTANGAATLQKFGPGFFTFDGANVAAVHLDGTYVGKAGLFGASVTTKPASPGETLLIYGTGLGATNPAVTPETVFSGAAPLSDPTQLTMTIGGQPATVQFAGMISNGLYQFNVTVPAAALGDQPISMSIGGQTSATTTTINMGN